MDSFIRGLIGGFELVLEMMLLWFALLILFVEAVDWLWVGLVIFVGIIIREAAVYFMANVCVDRVLVGSS